MWPSLFAVCGLATGGVFSTRVPTIRVSPPFAKPLMDDGLLIPSVGRITKRRKGYRHVIMLVVGKLKNDFDKRIKCGLSCFFEVGTCMVGKFIDSYTAFTILFKKILNTPITVSVFFFDKHPLVIFVLFRQSYLYVNRGFAGRYV